MDQGVNDEQCMSKAMPTFDVRIQYRKGMSFKQKRRIRKIANKVIPTILFDTFWKVLRIGECEIDITKMEKDQLVSRAHRPRSRLPREPKDYNDKKQVATYQEKLRKFFHL